MLHNCSTFTTIFVQLCNSNTWTNLHKTMADLISATTKVQHIPSTQSTHPFTWTENCKCLLKVIAKGVFLSFDFQTTIVIHIILPAVSTHNRQHTKILRHLSRTLGPSPWLSALMHFLSHSASLADYNVLASNPGRGGFHLVGLIVGMLWD